MLTLSDNLTLQPNHHLNGLGVVVNVDHPDPLVVEVLRLLREDHVGPAIAKLLLVYVKDSSLNFVLEQKFSEFFFEEFCLEILCNSEATRHAKLWKLEKSALLENSRDSKTVKYANI